MRRGEVLGLRWDRVDFKANQITINQGLVRVTGKRLVFQESKTKLSNRVIGLCPAAMAVLREQKKKQAENRLLAGGGYNTDLDLVSANEIGEPIDPRAFTKVFERLIKKAKLNKFCLLLCYNCNYFRFGFCGNQPFSTRFFCSKISRILQNEEKENTANSEENKTSLSRMEKDKLMMPTIKKAHQQRVPK